jgi:transketolase
VAAVNAGFFDSITYQCAGDLTFARVPVHAVEDHSVIGGLGDCFAEVLSEMSAHAPLVKLGIQDQFGESGEPAELYEKFGISADKIAEAVRKRLG